MLTPKTIDVELATGVKAPDPQLTVQTSQKTHVRTISKHEDERTRISLKKNYLDTSNSTRSIELSRALRTFDRQLSSDGRNESPRDEPRSGMFEVNQSSSSEDDSSDEDDEEDVTDRFLQAIEIAAYAHMVQWAENAYIIENKLLERDRRSLNERKTLTFSTEFCRKSPRCCCCHKKRRKTTILYRMNQLLICCPSLRCCTCMANPRKSTSPSLFVDSKYARNIEGKYLPLCCFWQEDDINHVDDQATQNCFVSLSLFSSLFIWFDLPLEVVVNRLRLVGSVMSQLFANVLEWIFFASVINASYNVDQHAEKLMRVHGFTTLRVRDSVLYVTTGCMILPELFHALYLAFAPGYVLRSTNRKAKQICLSMFGLRPLYELVWSFKYTTVMPYTSLQLQGLIMSDSGLHERWIIFTGLVTSLRELPLRIVQLFILIEYFPFWSSHGLNSLLEGGTLDQCVGIHVNEQTIFYVISFGLFVSATALSDQLEREMPYGTFPRRFSRILASPICNSTALLWSFVFIMSFFVDLFLRFAVLLPLAALEGLTSVLAVFLILFTSTSFAVSLTLSRGVTDTGTSNGTGTDIIQTTVQTTHLQNEKEHEVIDTRKDSNGLIRVKSWSASNKRAGSDLYDSGKHLQAFDVVSSPCCCFNKRPSWVDGLVETFPFVLWGLWVDLPLRLKWLRLNTLKKEKKQGLFQQEPSLNFFFVSSLSSIFTCSAVFIYNLYNLEVTWQVGQTSITCNKIVSPGSKCQLMSNVSCPSNLSSAFHDLDSLRLLSNWTTGCRPLAAQGNVFCMPEIRSGLTAHRMVSVAALQFLRRAHQKQFVFDYDGWLFTGFLLLLMLKILLGGLITQQFYCTKKTTNREQCNCLCRCCHKNRAGNALGKVTTRKKSLKRADEQIYKKKNSRASVLLNLWKEVDIWKSELRARDIQLMLRLSRVIPGRKALAGATEDDYMRVEVATLLLGTGGVVNVTLGEELHQVSIDTDLTKKKPSFRLIQTTTNVKTEVAQFKDQAKLGRLPSFDALTQLGNMNVVEEADQDEESEDEESDIEEIAVVEWKEDGAAEAEIDL